MRQAAWIGAVLAGALLAAGGAVAQQGGGDGGGSGSFGESLMGDLQRNPRLIEPGAERDRYLAYYGREGWDQRQAAARGAGAPYDGYAPARPYRPYR